MSQTPVPSTPVPFLQRVVPARVVALFVFHAVVFTACYLLAWQIRFDFSIPPLALVIMTGTMFVVVGVQLAFGFLFGFYRGWWRYVGIGDVIQLVAGLTSALAVMFVLWHTSDLLGLPSEWVKPPRGVLIIDWSFALLTLFGARVAARLTGSRSSAGAGSEHERRVVIVGAGDAGEALAREIEHRPQLGMKVAGFLDDQRAKWGSQIRGIRVYGPIASADQIARALGAEEALIALPSASGKRIREIISSLSASDLQFKTIPGMDQLVSGTVQVTQLRAVNVEDLLRRERIELPGDPVRAMFRGRSVLVTGAGGTIGSELAVQIAALQPEKILLVERSEFALYEVRKRLARELPDATVRIASILLDITDEALLEDLIAAERPAIALHAAAHKHVPLGEENPAEYLRNNALATRRLAEICDRHGVGRFVLISTDKAIHPTSVMGASKRAAEIALLDVVRRSGMSATVVRFGNVIGSSGSVIPLFMEQIAAGGPVTVTHPDVTRYFLRTSEAVSLVLQAATLGDHGNIFMLDMGEPLKIVDLARDMIRLSNMTEQEIPITFIGLRPGEKLFEEIRLEGEEIRPTVHPRIVITEAPQPAAELVAGWLSRVREAHRPSAAEAVAALKELVPEYTTPAPSTSGDPAPQAVPVG